MRRTNLYGDASSDILWHSFQTNDLQFWFGLAQASGIGTRTRKDSEPKRCVDALDAGV
jgi:hypothetical protein